MIPKQTLAREGIIGEHGNLRGELRKLPKRVVKLAGAELRRPVGNMRRLFESGRGLGAEIDAPGGSLPTQFCLNLGLDSNNDRHRCAPSQLSCLQ